VALVIAFPILVTGLMTKRSGIDPSKVQIELKGPADEEEESAPVVITPR
jgi:hypothetical protein